MQALHQFSRLILISILSFLFAEAAFSQTGRAHSFQIITGDYEIRFDRTDAPALGSSSGEGFQQWGGPLPLIINQMRPGSVIQTDNRDILQYAFRLEIRGDAEAMEKAERMFLMFLKENYDITIEDRKKISGNRVLSIVDEPRLHRNIRAGGTAGAGSEDRVKIENGNVTAAGVTLSELAEILSDFLEIPVSYEGRFTGRISFEMDLARDASMVNADLENRYGLHLKPADR